LHEKWLIFISFGHGIDVRSGLARTAAATAAAATALLAPAAHAQVPSVELPAVPEVASMPANPPTAAISPQYHDVEAIVREALQPPPAPKPVAAPVAPAAPRPDPEPEYRPAAKQYHSETPSDAPVTQSQPGNVNVSIRINSPGDDGPVTQINAAGGDVVSVVEPPAPGAGGSAPAPAAPPASTLPDNWTWVWTSACFGGGAGAQPASAATAGPSWNWQWSCDDGSPVSGLSLPDPDGPVLPSPVTGGDFVSPAVTMPPAELRATPQTRAKAQQERRERPDRSASRGQGSPPPPATLPAAGRLAAPPRPARASPVEPAPAARARRDARRAAHARAVVNPDFPPGASGPSAGAATGLGAAISLLLGAWIAVLVCALALVVPRMRRRRWSGPPWRLPPPRPARLERPG
jgi:hypothetical protein